MRAAFIVLCDDPGYGHILGYPADWITLTLDPMLQACSVQYRDTATTEWTTRSKSHQDPAMGYRRRRPGRDIRIAPREDPLPLYVGTSGSLPTAVALDAVTVATWHPELLLRIFSWGATLGSIAARLRRHRCGRRRARIKANLMGSVGDDQPKSGGRRRIMTAISQPAHG